ncbi:MAG: type II secretion system protein [Dehalococcoidales bacterium]
MRRTLKRAGSLSMGQRGVAFLEILVGLALLGIIGVAFLNGMTSTFKAIGISQEMVAAESLAKSQIEYLKVQGYILVADYDPDYPATSYELITVPSDLAAAGYSVNISTPEAILSELEGGFELQSINITVRRNSEQKMQISIYRHSG